MPSKRAIELHVGADAVDVLDGVEGGGLGVAGDDRLVDHAVLGRVDAGAAGSAIESSRSRCHSGWSISEATWSANASRTGLPVSAASWRWKEPVGRVPGGAVDRLGLHRRQQLLGDLVALGAGRGEPATAGSSCARASSTALGLASCAPPSDGSGPTTTSRAVAGLDDALQRQRGERLAHRRAADLERARQVALGRQPLPGREQAGADVAGEALGDLLVALQRVRKWFGRKTAS